MNLILVGKDVYDYNMLVFINLLKSGTKYKCAKFLLGKSSFDLGNNKIKAISVNLCYEGKMGNKDSETLTKVH